MAMIEIDVPEEMAYMLAHVLADKGADIDKKAWEWKCDPDRGEDAFYYRLKAECKFLYRLAAKIGKLTKPVEGVKGVGT